MVLMAETGLEVIVLWSSGGILMGGAHDLFSWWGN